MQQLFSKSSLFNALFLAVLILGVAAWLRANRPPLDVSAAGVPVRWEPLALSAAFDGRARLAGAWRLRAADPRIGGISGLALDRGRLLGLTDSGMLVTLTLPPLGGTASIRPLPAVAGNPRSKIGRDSEALAPAAGGGWWVAFEQKHQLVRYDPAFRRAVQRILLTDTSFRPNRGVEALAGGGRLVAFPERSGVSDAARLDDGSILLLARSFGLAGFTSAIHGRRIGTISLPLGALDNPEGLAVQQLSGGQERVWVITDNDQRRWRRTVLLAIDLPPKREP